MSVIQSSSIQPDISFRNSGGMTGTGRWYWASTFQVCPFELGRIEAKKLIIVHLVVCKSSMIMEVASNISWSCAIATKSPQLSCIFPPSMALPGWWCFWSILEHNFTPFKAFCWCSCQLPHCIGFLPTILPSTKHVAVSFNHLCTLGHGFRRGKFSFWNHMFTPLFSPNVIHIYPLKWMCGVAKPFCPAKYNNTVFHVNRHMPVSSWKLTCIGHPSLQFVCSVLLQWNRFFIYLFIYFLSLLRQSNLLGFFLLVACPTHTNPPGSGLGTGGIVFDKHIDKSTQQMNLKVRSYIRIRIRIRIYLLARRNLLWDILRLPSSRRAALDLYVILTQWRGRGANQPPYAMLHRSSPRYALCLRTMSLAGEHSISSSWSSSWSSAVVTHSMSSSQLAFSRMLLLAVSHSIYSSQLILLHFVVDGFLLWFSFLCFVLFGVFSWQGRYVRSCVSPPATTIQTPVGGKAILCFFFFFFFFF